MYANYFNITLCCRVIENVDNRDHSFQYLKQIAKQFRSFLFKAGGYWWSHHDIADQKWPWPRERNHRRWKHTASRSHLSGQAQQPAAIQQHHFAAGLRTAWSQRHTGPIGLQRKHTSIHITYLTRNTPTAMEVWWIAEVNKTHSAGSCYHKSNIFQCHFQQ